MVRRQWGPGDIARFSREEFVQRRWAYRKGEHVSWLGPTESGKTTFAGQLLAVTARPSLPSLTLVMKPKDDTADEWSKTLGHKRIKTWPPPWHLPWQDRPSGYQLWPRFTFDPDVDDPHMAEQFRAGIRACYAKGGQALGASRGSGCIVFADEAWGLTQELGLGKDLVTVWTKGRSMGCGLWSGTQKPSHVPLHMYNQAKHLFLAYDPDEQARKRYGEIGGVDPRLVRDVTAELGAYEWLYVGRRGPVMCIVEA